MIDRISDDSDRSPGRQMGVTNAQTNNAQLVHDTLWSNQPSKEHEEPPISDEKVPLTEEQQMQLIRILNTLTDDDVDEAFACWRQFEDNASRLRATSSDKERKAQNNFPTKGILTFLVLFAGKKARRSLHEPARIPTGGIPTARIPTGGIPESVFKKLVLRFPPK